ncbi:hypothetical protein D3C73_1604880 [compost metagenome]
MREKSGYPAGSLLYRAAEPEPGLEQESNREPEPEPELEPNRKPEKASPPRSTANPSGWAWRVTCPSGTA